MTIPAKLRSKLRIQEGSMLELLESSDSIILKPLAPPKAGKPVGTTEYRKILQELDQLREHWR